MRIRMWMALMALIAICGVYLRRQTQIAENGTTEIDIDILENNRVKIFVGSDQIFYCDPATPPLSHSWVYECKKQI
jgi:hypothetical protein